MRKLLVLVLSAILLLGFASMTLAATIKTSGEIDIEYFNKLWTGESTDYSLIELGLYNDITINDKVSAVVNFWYESDQTQVQTYNVVDDAYITYRFGDANKFIIGKTRYWKLQGQLDSLQGFFRGLLGSDDMLEPPVSLIGEFKLADSFSLTAGYLSGAANSTLVNGYTVDSSGDVVELVGNYDDDKGFNIPFIRGSYVNGNFSANFEVLKLSQGWLDVDPATDYMVDVNYKFGKFSVWAAYLGVAQVLDNNKIWVGGVAPSAENTDKFGLIGFTASLGKLWASVDYAVYTPESSCWVEDTDGNWNETNWKDDKPFGVNISYWFGNNTTLMYTYATNTGNWQDKSRLRLCVKF